jgi:[CysO sulfur-carrier protein]-S-L-cysteine hydrolase
MISVALSSCQVERFRRELRQAGNQEIGGVMVAEHLEDAAFRLAGFSVQRSGGSFASFVRKPALHRRFLRRFFEQTGQEFERFNYLGEWHSHPCFVARPSSQDIVQMQALVDDPNQAALFAVLLIVRLGRHNDLEVSAYAFRRGCSPVEVQLLCNHKIQPRLRDPAPRIDRGHRRLSDLRKRR